MAFFALMLPFCFLLSAPSNTVESVRSLLKARRTLEALQEIKKLQKENKNDPEIQFDIGKIFQELAASRAELLKQQAHDSPQAHELIGKILEAHNKLSESLVEYKLAAQKDSVLPGIHFLIGNLYWKQRDLNAAVPELELELRLNPNHMLANLRIGESLLITEAEQPEKAVFYLRKAASDSHTNLEAHRELGKALRIAGHYQEALMELRFVAKHQPKDGKVHAQLAALYRVMGNSEAAQREMETQLRLLQSQREASMQLRQAKPDH